MIGEGICQVLIIFRRVYSAGPFIDRVGHLFQLIGEGIANKASLTSRDDTPHVGAASTRAQLPSYSWAVVQLVGPQAISRALVDQVPKAFLLSVHGTDYAMGKVMLFHVCWVLAFLKESNLPLESLSRLLMSFLQLFMFAFKISIT